MAGPGVAVSVEGLTVRFGRHTAIENVTLSIAAGSTTAILGRNGAGKSTLLQAIAGLVRPSSGRVVTSLPRRALALAPQSTDIDRRAPLTTADLVSSGLWSRVGMSGKVAAADDEAVRAALVRVGLGDKSNAAIAALSGGQFQRALFARVIVQDAVCVLLDEPFAALDAASTDILLDVLAEWREAGKTIIAAMHDHALVQRAFDHAVLLSTRVVMEGDVTAVLARAHEGEAA